MRGWFADEDSTKAPSFHPESILAQLETQNFQPGRQPVGAAKSCGDIPETEENPDDLIHVYKAGLDNQEPDALKVGAHPEIPMEEILDSAKVSLDTFADTTVRKVMANPRLLGNAGERLNPPTKTLTPVGKVGIIVGSG